MTMRRVLLIGLNLLLMTGFGPLIMQTSPVLPEPHRTVRLEGTQTARMSDGRRATAAIRSLFGPISPVREQEPQPAPEPAGPALRLVGTVLGQSRPLALVEQAGTIRRVQEGDEIGGWHVHSITRRGLRLMRLTESLDVPLDPSR